jgi:hypothetical protein
VEENNARELLRGREAVEVEDVRVVWKRREEAWELRMEAMVWLLACGGPYARGGWRMLSSRRGMMEEKERKGLECSIRHWHHQRRRNASFLYVDVVGYRQPFNPGGFNFSWGEL